MGSRWLKESICDNRKIARLSWFEEVLFYRLIVKADDYGCMDGRPNIIRKELFPLANKVTTASVMRGLERLTEVGLTECFFEKGYPVVCIKSWEQHQRTRAEKSKYLPQKGKSDEVQNLVTLYNQLCSNLVRCEYHSENTEKLLQEMQKKGFDQEKFRQLFTKANESDFLGGKGKNGWKAYLDWLLVPENAANVLAGKYGGKLEKPVKGGDFIHIDSHNYSKEDYEKMMSDLSGFED